MTEHPWRVLHVISNHEKRVVQHLASRSLEHYLPLYALKSRWSDRTVALERPLFPGYVFTRFAPTERIGALSTPGAVSYTHLDVYKRQLCGRCLLPGDLVQLEGRAGGSVV